MANTTDIMVICFLDETAAISNINKNAKVDPRRLSGSNSGGTHSIGLECWAFCGRSEDVNIKSVIKSINEAKWSHPENVAVSISTDDGLDFSFVLDSRKTGSEEIIKKLGY